MEHDQQAAIKGGNILLTPINRHTFQDLLSMQNDVKEMYLWTARRDILSESQMEETFIHKLNEYFHSYLLIYNQKNDCCGLVYSYDYNVLDGFAYVTIYLKKEYRNQGTAFISGMMFLDYLYTYFPIRKIYCDVISYNQHSYHFLTKAGLNLEAQLKSHKFYAGEYYDLCKFSMFREDFYAKYENNLITLKALQ